MIKANELRVGNWINHTGSNVKVDAIDSDDDYIGITADDDGNVQSDCESAIPIPLNPEILLVSGFRKQDYPEGYYWINLGESDYDGGLQFYNGDLYVYTPQTPNTENALETNVKYLHQLQNLYFALTGKELEIKL